MKYCLFLAFVFFDLMIASANQVSPAADDDVDLSLANMTLTAGDEKNFQYTFNLTNSGTSEVQGYNMKLTFSANDVLDASDNFVIIVPLTDAAAQWIGPAQTLLKTEHYYASSPAGYLPVGSWYVFAEINYDRIVAETNYTNNSARSTNKITVGSYTIPFPKNPTITAITENSFMINAFFDGDLTDIYYKVQANGALVPNTTTMFASTPIYPWESDVTVSGLGPAYAYDVYVMGEFPDGKVTVIYKIDVTTLGTVAPTLSLSQSQLTLSPANKNNDSAPGSYTITGFHLTSNVIVSATGQMVVSKDNVTFSPQITFLASAFNGSVAQNVYVKYLTDGSTGVKTATINNASAGATTQPVSVSVSVYDPVNGSFNDLTSLDETGWSAFSVLGYHTWTLVDLEASPPDQRVEGVDKGIQIDGALNGITPNEDWLISPEINLSGFEYEPTIKFRSYSSGTGATLKLRYSANYTGTGDPRLATWFEADVEFPEVNSNKWENTSVVVLNKESKIYFAFVYTSTVSAATKWTLDDWSIKDNLLSIPSTVLSYADVEVGTSSASQSILVKIAGYGDITVTASSGFQVSLNNSTFSSSVVIPESEAESGKTIYIRFTPTSQAQGLQGTLTFTSTELSVVKNNLVGSSLFTTATSKALETSNFIYPNPTSGPVHIDTQAFYSQTGEMPVWIANGIGGTVAHFSSTSGSLEANLSDVIANLKPGLYYITVQTDKAIFRNKLVRE
ncbi:MAG TPA: choice-of-anchor J domain-containing protein [Chryseolinea sp.]|nr:choice-of-anchor J domain-containing protein [Chryseolinea sp.]